MLPSDIRFLIVELEIIVSFDKIGLQRTIYISGIFKFFNNS